jgi:hypothetical protein
MENTNYNYIYDKKSLPIKNITTDLKKYKLSLYDEDKTSPPIKNITTDLKKYKLSSSDEDKDYFESYKLSNPLQYSESDLQIYTKIFNSLYIKPKVPKKSYPLDKEKVIEYINASPDEFKSVLTKLFNNTIHISYKTLKFILTQNFKELIFYCKKNNIKTISIFLDNTSKKQIIYKSNFWIIQHFIKFIKDNSIDDFVIDFIYKKEDIIYLDSNNRLILLLDDCIYTGLQMKDNVKDIYKYSKELSFNIYILVSCISEDAIKLLKEVAKHHKLILSKNIITIYKLSKYVSSDEELKLLGSNKYLIYFDHKLPDSVSTYNNIYNGYVFRSFKLDQYYTNNILSIIPVIKNCDLKQRVSIDTECPDPPYKTKDINNKSLFKSLSDFPTTNISLKSIKTEDDIKKYKSYKKQIIKKNINIETPEEYIEKINQSKDDDLYE